LILRKFNMLQNHNYSVGNNPITQTNNLRSMFQHHGNQFLKFHFLSFLTAEERTKMRVTCQIIKQNIPKPQYSYFKTTVARARLEKNVGSVETCGHPVNGGDSSEVSSELQSEIKTIVSSRWAFAAIKQNGRVITWGGPNYGGDSTSVSSDLQSGVNTIVSSRLAFASIKENGRVITWGDSRYGGDSTSVSVDLQSGVKTIVTTFKSFAALKANGSVIIWGNFRSNGVSANVLQFLQNGVIQIEAVGDDWDGEFRATKSDGTQVQWS